MITNQFLRVVFVTLSLIVLVFTHTWSQEAAGPVDKWDGKFRIDGERFDDVTFNVQGDKGVYKILSLECDVFSDDNIPVKNFNWNDSNIIYFTWSLGNSHATCEARKQDETEYVGHCKFSDSGESIDMIVFPQVE